MTIDESLLAKLTVMIKSGDPQMAAAAFTAIAKAGESALPALRDATMQGSMQQRNQAVAAIGEIGGPKAIEILGEILKTGDRQSATQAAGALANLGGKEAREMLIEAALSDRAQTTGALGQLAAMQGDDVDQALLSVIKQGTSADRRAALPRMLKMATPTRSRSRSTSRPAARATSAPRRSACSPSRAAPRRWTR